MPGSVQKLKKWAKVPKKGPKMPKSYIPRTVGRRNFVDPSFLSETSYFYECFIHYIPLRCWEVPKNSKNGQKGPKKGSLY